MYAIRSYYVAVFGAKIVAPLRDAVRLVDGEEGDGQARESFQKSGQKDALGRDVEHVEPPFAKCPFSL